MTLRMVMLATFLLCFSTPSLAFDWQSLWLNNDQRGKKALEQESYQQAAEQFKQAEWQAYSHYKNGEFEQAASLFSADNAVSAYNKGNALAQLGDLEGAISFYQQALEMQPDFADAKANKALLEQLLEQQQQSSDEQQQNSEQESQQDDEQQEGGSSQLDDLDKDGEQSAEQQEQENSEQQEAQNAEQERSENQEAEQNNVEQQDAQGTDTEESEKGEQEAALQQVEESELSPEELKQQRQLEQWFRAVEDNPGELLKNKFRYQYEQNRRRQQHIDRESDQVW